MNLEEENKILKKEIQNLYFDEKSADFTMVFLILTLGIILGYIWCYCALTKSYMSEIKELKNSNEIITNSPEMLAIRKCNNEDYWKSECIAFELNNKR